MKYFGIRQRQMAGVLLWLAAGSYPVVAQSVLSLQEAEQQALARDRVIHALMAKEEALHEEAIAANTLPDPQLKLGMMNLPTDSFSRTQEPMTQIQLGVQQMLPRGDTLAIRSRRVSHLATGQSAQMQERKRRVMRDVRMNWLELYYWEQALDVVKENRKLFRQLVKTTQSHYAAGRRNQQDVTRAELELGLLDDRIIRIHTMQEKYRAELGKWLGAEMAMRQLKADMPMLTAVKPKAEIASMLEQHPYMAYEKAQVAASQAAVALAKEAYKPEWMLDLTYGYRDGTNANGSERADFLSAMVKIDVPLFTGKRQDKRLSASKRNLFAAQDIKEERRRELNRMLDSGYADWQRLQERYDYYRTTLKSKAHDNVKAALHAYQSDTDSFTTLMRASIAELEIKLNALRMHVDLMKAQARLLYLAGEKTGEEQ